MLQDLFRETFGDEFTERLEKLGGSDDLIYKALNDGPRHPETPIPKTQNSETLLKALTQTRPGLEDSPSQGVSEALNLLAQ